MVKCRFLQVQGTGDNSSQPVAPVLLPSSTSSTTLYCIAIEPTLLPSMILLLNQLTDMVYNVITMFVFSYIQYRVFEFKKFSSAKDLQQGGQSLVCVLSILSDQWGSYRIWAHLQEDFNLADEPCVKCRMSDASKGSQPILHK